MKQLSNLPSSNTKIPKATRKEARLLGCHQLSARPGFVAHQLHRALQKVPWLGLLGFLKTNKSLGWHILEAAKRAPSSYILASGFLLPSQESLPSSGPSGHRPGERQVPGRCETTVQDKAIPQASSWCGWLHPALVSGNRWRRSLPHPAFETSQNDSVTAM